MSDDLISRKELLEVIDISFIIPILKMNLRPEHEAVLKIREIIMNMPIAFDKEKVIEEIRNQLELSDTCAYESGYPTEASYYNGRTLGHEIDIEIVEKGGLNG